jgi:hypothetical protein
MGAPYCARKAMMNFIYEENLPLERGRSSLNNPRVEVFLLQGFDLS